MDKPRSLDYLIFIVAFDRLGYVSVNDCPAGLEPPSEARNRRKATLKIQRNTTPGIIRLDPKCHILFIIFNIELITVL